MPAPHDLIGNTELPDLPLSSIAATSLTPEPTGELEIPDVFKFVDDEPPEAEVLELEAEPILASAGDEHIPREYFMTYLDAIDYSDWERGLRNLRIAISMDPRSFALVPPSKYTIEEIIGAERNSVRLRCSRLEDNSSVEVRSFAELGVEQSAKFAELEKRFQFVNHPNFVLPEDFGTLGEGKKRRAYLIEGKTDWPTLDADVKDQGALTPKQILVVLNLLVDTLLAAHDRGVFHGELNPQTVHIKKEGKNWGLRITRLGLAATIGRQNHDSDYVAPELRSSKSRTQIDATAEVYSLGKVCCYALFGTPNPDRKEWEELPRPLADLLTACIHHDPRERLQNLDEVSRELTRRGAALGASIPLKPDSTPSKKSSPPPKRRPRATPPPLPKPAPVDDDDFDPPPLPNRPPKKGSAKARYRAFEQQLHSKTLIGLGLILSGIAALVGLVCLFI